MLNPNVLWTKHVYYVTCVKYGNASEKGIVDGKHNISRKAT